MTIFKLSKNDWLQIMAAEIAGHKIGLPFAGTAASLFIRFGTELLSNTAQIKIPALEPGKYDPLLIQARDYLNYCYKNQPNRPKQLPYVECFKADYTNGKSEIRIQNAGPEVRLTPFEDQKLEQLRDIGFAKMKEMGRYRHDSNTIRLDNFERLEDGVLLKIRMARYSDQAKSNLILDFKNEEERTFRKAFYEEFNHQLPPLNDYRLANTIGVAALIFYRDRGILTPYFVPRTKEVAVFNKAEWHCTASGAAEWPRYESEINETFEDYILDDLHMELKEEVGLEQEDLTNLLPLALCRELTRGGKPQLFFIGFTKLTFEELNQRMAQARALASKNNEPIEIYNMPKFRFPKNLDGPENIIAEFENSGFTSEAAAALYYSCDFIQKMEE